MEKLTDKHFSERLALKDKFSILAREVLGIKKKIPFRYFELKKRFRDKHGIDVRSPGTVRRATIGFKARKEQKKESSIKPDKDARRWNTIT